MSSIMSPVEKLDDLYFHPLPAGKPIRIAKAVRVKNLTVMQGENGRLYATGGGFRDRVCYTVSEWPWTEAMMSALCKLGVITPEQRDWHLAVCRDRDRERDMKHHAWMLQTGAERLGVPLPKAAREAIQRWTA